MPVEPDAVVPPLTVGWTPTYGAPRLAATLGIARVWVKDEGRQPTASLKDRASAMALVKAGEQGAEVVTTASTGNAAAALSGLAASIGQKDVIFVPESAPEAIPVMARGSGVFAEPAGAAAYAGLVAAVDRGLVDPAARVVVLPPATASRTSHRR